MPWSEITPMDERLQCVADLRRGTEEMAVRCRRYGISRKTGYQWRDRYDAEGAAGLAERSHAVHTCPHATAPAAVDALGALRRRHPTWGPKKLLTVLAPRRPRLVARASSPAPRRPRLVARASRSRRPVPRPRYSNAPAWSRRVRGAAHRATPAGPPR